LFRKISEILFTNFKTATVIVIIISALSWYYFDEIKDGLGTSIEWIKKYFSRPSSGSNRGDSNGDITPNAKNSGQAVQRLKAEDIKLIDPKGKAKLNILKPKILN
jgi:hypothetical protein